MKLSWKTAISVATMMMILNGSTITGSQLGKPMEETVKVVTAVAPVFPPIVLASNTSGKVVIEVIIDKTGRVISTRVVDGDPLLRKIKSIEETALQWRFTSTAEDTPRTVRLTFAFQISPRDTPATELTPVFSPPYRIEVRHIPLDPIIHKDPPTSVRRTPRVKR